MLYVERVRNYTKIMGLNRGVEQAVGECIEEGILAEFLSNWKAEAIAVSIFEYNAKRERKLWERDQREYLRAQVKEEMREEIRDEVRAEMQDEVRAEVQKEVRAEIQADWAKRHRTGGRPDSGDHSHRDSIRDIQRADFENPLYPDVHYKRAGRRLSGTRTARCSVKQIS